MITIKKDEQGNIKFYPPNYHEPCIVIYPGSKRAVMRDIVFDNQNDANELSHAASLAGVFLRCVQTEEGAINRKNIDVVYINIVMNEEKVSKYSARLFLERLYSDNIVTINRKDRIRMEFTTFYYKDGRIHVNYKPVVW